jgi:hypothetical protein
MAAAGYDVTVGDIWGLNELITSVRAGTGTARQNARDLIRGLYLGDGSGPPVQGVVWTPGIGQSTGDLTTVYKPNLKSWFTDSAFWADVGPAVRFWSQEVYGDVRRWAVPGTGPRDAPRPAGRVRRASQRVVRGRTAVRLR